MTDVVMPQMGESIVEGTLTKWLKKTGDHVERDEPLFEISTDKVDTEIPSPGSRRFGRGAGSRKATTVGIGTVVGRIEDGAASPRNAVAYGSRSLCGRRRSTANSPAPGHPRTRCRERRPLSDPRSGARACRSRVSLWTPFTAGSQNGARVQHRSVAGERHRAPADASPSRTWNRTCPRQGARTISQVSQPPAAPAPAPVAQPAPAPVARPIETPIVSQPEPPAHPHRTHEHHAPARSPNTW